VTTASVCHTSSHAVLLQPVAVTVSTTLESARSVTTAPKTASPASSVRTLADVYTASWMRT
jgi:hypothetical protein